MNDRLPDADKLYLLHASGRMACEDVRQLIVDLRAGGVPETIVGPLEVAMLETIAKLDDYLAADGQEPE